MWIKSRVSRSALSINVQSRVYGEKVEKPTKSPYYTFVVSPKKPYLSKKSSKSYEGSEMLLVPKLIGFLFGMWGDLLLSQKLPPREGWGKGQSVENSGNLRGILWIKIFWFGDDLKAAFVLLLRPPKQKEELETSNHHFLSLSQSLYTQISQGSYQNSMYTHSDKSRIFLTFSVYSDKSRALSKFNVYSLR